jgi:hypothetical protein
MRAGAADIRRLAAGGWRPNPVTDDLMLTARKLPVAVNGTETTDYFPPATLPAINRTYRIS